MEFNLRDILLIISVLAIAGLCIHGMYTLRKERKNPYKLKKTVASESTEEMEQRMFDNSGFDQDGVGPKKVVANPVKKANSGTDNGSEQRFPSQDNIAAAAPANGYGEDSGAFKSGLSEPHGTDNGYLDPVLGEEIISVANDQATDDSNPYAHQHFNDPAMDIASEPAMAEMERIFEAHEQGTKSAGMRFTEPSFNSEPENVEEVVPEVAENNQYKRRVEKTKAEIRRDQIEIDFVEEEKTKPAADIEQEVLAISVVAGQNQLIAGAALLPSLLTLGMKYGDMNIFHRHQDNSGKGPIHFSLANMINPGTFDLDNMENFATTGLTLFMTLPNAGDPSKVFKLMLSAAKQLASEFGGQVLDGQRSVMTRQTEQHYLTKIREFDRKSRIANV
ncbi:cell division protein ZipA [Thalassotalea litorea]|uniref:cell division protein ZipA n=1 Tax=Thalassotalea litorea TaxID=2020715 RepID=UPI003734F5A8